MGCDYYINTYMNINYYNDSKQETDSISEMINQEKVYDSDYDSDSDLEYDDYTTIYQWPRGWLISDKSEITKYTEIIEKLDIAMIKITDIFVSSDTMRNY